METFVIYWTCTEAGSRITCMKTGRKETKMKRYFWTAAAYCCILMDFKTGKPVGSVIPTENGDCIIRWGHNPDQPMQEDVISFYDTDRTTLFAAAGAVMGRLNIRDCDISGLALFDPDVFKLSYEYMKDVLKEGAENA